MVEGFLVFCVYLFVPVGCCPSSDLHRFVNREVVVWVQVDLCWFKMDCLPSFCPPPNLFSTDRCWQNTAGASTLTRKEQRAPQICLKHWATRRCWKSWILAAVLRSQQGRGKKFVVPSGSIWRMQFSFGALQREMVEGFLVFCFPLCLCWKLFEFTVDEIVVWVGVDRDGVEMDYAWSWHLPNIFFDSDKTLQVLWRRNARSRGRRRFAWSLEPVDTAGSVGFSQLFRDPCSSVAKSSGWRLAEAADGTGHPEGRAPKASTQSWRRHVSDTFDFDDWNCSRWQRGTGGTEAIQNCSRSRLGFRCDGANGTFELFAHWSFGSSLLSWDPGSSVAKSSWCQVAQFEEGRFQIVPRREKWLRGYSCFLRVFICLCWMLSEFSFVKVCEVFVWVGVDR